MQILENKITSVIKILRIKILPRVTYYNVENGGPKVAAAASVIWRAKNEAISMNKKN